MKAYDYNKLKDVLRKWPRQYLIEVTPLVVYCDKLIEENLKLKQDLRVKKIEELKTHPSSNFHEIRQKWIELYKKDPGNKNVELALRAMNIDPNTV